MMLAARNIFLAARRNRKPTARSYVQDGLIAMWDGIENAGWGVHDAAATTWKDLVGSDDLIVTTAGVWSDDGIDNFATAHRIAYRSSFTFDAPLTQELVFQWAGNQPGAGNGIMFHISQWYSGNSMLRGIHSNQGTFFQLKTCVANTGVPASGTKMAISSVYDSSGVTSAFKNGQHVTLSGGAGNWYASDAAGVNLGNRAGNARGVYIKFFSVRFYSRALTEEEIAANCAVDKARFNLP